MIDTNDLKEKIRTTIFPNGRGAINAADHQALLLDMADGIGAMNDKLNAVATDTESNNVAIEDLQENKVDHGSYAPDLSVGVADHLAGHDEPTPSEFTFRRSGGGAILSGNARVQSVKGNSVVWNQLINSTYLNANDATITKTDTGYTIVPTGNAPGLRTNAPKGDIIPIVGHKYAIIYEKVGGSRRKYLNWGGFNASLTSPIFTATDATKTQLTIYSYNETETFTITTPLLIDLTKMFGAGNEPTTIEEYHSRIPQGIDMDAYNEGEVIHMNVDAVKSVGFNQWDEVWENGIISESTGEDYDTIYAFRSKNVIRVLPNTQYYFKKPIGVVTYLMFYDDDMNFVQWLDPFATSGDGGVFTTPNAPYMRFVCHTETYNHDICINISDAEKNGTYEPYISRMQSLEILRKYFPNGMRSAGTAHDEIRYNKTTQKWEKVQRIGSVDMGTLVWNAGSFGVYGAAVSGILPAGDNYVSGIVQSRYAFDTGSGVSEMVDKSIRRYSTNVYIKDTAYTDAASFKAAMAGVMLYYELAEPIVTEIEEAFNLDYEVWNGGTEQAIADTPTSAFKADIIYGFNAYGVIKELREQLATLQAAIAKMNV